MKGKHKIEVRSKRIVFTIELERNITILRGDSATGKTTLVEMLSAYENYGRKSGITIVCDKTCRVLSGALWEAQLKDIQDAIVFVDEGSTFVSSLDFARAIQKTDNYYVLVTREDLSTLPYSVNAILELKKTTSRFKRTYNKAYPIYDSLSASDVELGSVEMIRTLVERGIGISFLPYYAVKDSIKNGTLVKIDVSENQIEVWRQLIYHKNKWVSPAMRAMIKLIKEYEKD